MTTPIIVTKLPYLGEHKAKTKRIINQITQAIPFSELHDYEREQVNEALHISTDPYEVLAAKIEHLADLLGCTEAKAERVLFHRLASKPKELNAQP